MTGKFFKSPHFWANIAITLVLIFIYRAWPWRSWDFDESLWRWFGWLSPLYTLAIVEFMLHVIGILFLVPIIYAAIIFSWRGALVAYLLSLFGVLPITLNVWSLSSFITNMTLLLLPLFIASIIAFELARRRRD